MKKLFTVSFIFIFCSVTYSQQKMKFIDAVIAAGKQRTLVEAIAKNKVFIKHGKKKNSYEKDLNNSILEFELSLEILKDFSFSDEVSYKIEIQELAFKRFKNLIYDTDKTSLNEAILMNPLFLKICNDVFYSFLDKYEENVKETSFSFSGISLAIKASSNIGFLTEQLTLFHAINNFKEKTIYPNEIEKIAELLNKSLNFLTISEFNTLEIDDVLSKSIYYLKQSKKNLFTGKKESRVLTNIHPEELNKLNSTVLQKSSPLTKLYINLTE